MRSRSATLVCAASPSLITVRAGSAPDVHPVWPIALVALGYAGYIKGIPQLAFAGVDLTALFLAVAVVGALARLLRHAYDSKALAGAAVVWLSFSIGMVNGLWNEGGSYKVLLLLTVTAFCAAAPAMLLTTPRSRRWFLVAVLGFAVVMAVGLIVAPDQGAQSEFGRRTLEGSNSIGTARVVGAGAVIALMMGLGSRAHRWLWLVGAAGLAAATVLVGSRGPFVALFVSAAIVLVTARFFRGSRRVPTLVIGAIALVALLLYVTRSHNRAAARIAGFVTGETVDHNRLFLVRQSLSLIASRPLGIGWGGFTEAPTDDAAYYGVFAYPHNMLLEVLVEAGWLAGVVLVGLVIWSLRGYLLQSGSPGGVSLYALGVYWFLVAQTSGDVNSNRMTWVTLLLGVVLHRRGSPLAPEGVPHPEIDTSLPSPSKAGR